MPYDRKCRQAQDRRFPARIRKPRRNEVTVTTTGTNTNTHDHHRRGRRIVAAAGTGSSPRRGPADDGAARLRDAALSAARAGCYVFPVQAGSKVPALHGQQGCPATGVCADGHQGWEQRATRDEAQIRDWFSTERNIGIATGRSGLLVIDLDDGRGETAPAPWTGARHGRDVLAMLAAQAGQPLPVDTLHVATPSRGEHLYYRVPAGMSFRNTASTLGFKIDTRSGGGFIVGPGSVRPEGSYRVLRPGPVAELPGWLATALTPAPPPTPSCTPIALPAERAGRYLAAILDNETDQVRHARKGQRRATLLAAARTLGRLVGGRELSWAQAHTALLAAADTHIGTDQFTHTEAEKTIEDGMAFGANLPRTLRRDTGGAR